MKYKTNFRKQWKLIKFSVVLETPFVEFLWDKKIASTLQTLTRKDFFKNWKIARCGGLVQASAIFVYKKILISITGFRESQIG